MKLPVKNLELTGQNGPTEAARKPVDTDKQESETSEKDLKTGYQTRIILNSGKEFNGVLVEYSDDKLILDIKGSRITFAKNAIQNIIQ